MPNPSTAPPNRRLSGLPLVAAAWLAFLVGVALLLWTAAQPRERSGGLGERVQLGGLALTVTDAGWVSHDMASMGQMPAAAMPDMPAEGSVRLKAVASLENTGRQAAEVDAADFALLAAGQEWPVQRSVLPAGKLAAGASAVGDLYFEVPEDRLAAAGAIRLAMTKGAGRALITLTMPGHMPAHEVGTS